MSSPRPSSTPALFAPALFAATLCAALLGSSLALPGPADAQTAPGSPGGSGSPGSPGSLVGPAPSRGVRAAKPDSTLPAAKRTPLPKPTAAERAEKRKLDHDLNICIGC